MDQSVGDVKLGVMTILPAGPDHEVLIRLLQEIEEELRGHVLSQYTLKQSHHL